MGIRLAVLAPWIVSMLAAQSPRVGTVSGTVFVDVLDEPPEEAYVEIDGQRTRTGSDGSFQLSGVLEGQRLLMVASPGFKMQMVSFRLQSGQELRLPPIPISVAGMCGGLGSPTLTHDPQMRGRATIRGQVSMESPSLLTRITVTLMKDGMPAKTVKSGPSAGFEFKEVEPGWYRVRLEHDGFYPREEPLARIQEDYHADFGPIYIESVPRGIARNPNL